MSSTSTNKQPLLIDRPLIEVEVLTTAAVGDRNLDTYKVQGGQGPVLLVDMDRALSDDDVSGGVIDTIELVRNESVPDVDIEVYASGIATQRTYSTGMHVYVASGFYEAEINLTQSSPTTPTYQVYANKRATYLTFASGDLVSIPSGIPSYTTVTTTNSGTGVALAQFDYIYVSDANAVTGTGLLPSGVGFYQYSGSVQLSGVPAEFQYKVASGLVYLGSDPGTATSTSGYYLYTSSGFSAWDSATDYTAGNGFSRLGTRQPYYLYSQTYNQYDLIYVTNTSFVNDAGQIPNGSGVYQYVNEESISSRPDLTSFTVANGFVHLSSSQGAYSNGSGYYRYDGTTSLVAYDRSTRFTTAAGFSYVGTAMDENFDEVEVCFYHVRQKVNPVANDGDYKFIGSVKLAATDSRIDALTNLPHLSTPVPQAVGSLGADKPGRNRGLYLERGDALYCGLYATTGTAVNYAPGVTVIAQGGYY